MHLIIVFLEEHVRGLAMLCGSVSHCVLCVAAVTTDGIWLKIKRSLDL